MKKILITTTMIALAGVTAMAQPIVKTDTTVTVEYNSDKYRVETAPFKANWFVGVDGGAQIYFGEHGTQCKFGDRLAPALNVYVGKWFTPAVGQDSSIAASVRREPRRTTTYTGLERQFLAKAAGATGSNSRNSAL